MALMSPGLFFLLIFLSKAIPSQGQNPQQYFLNSGFSTLPGTGLSGLQNAGLKLPNMGGSPGSSALSSSGLSLGTSPTNGLLSSLSSVLLPSNGLSLQSASPKFMTTGVPTSQSLISQPGLPALKIASPSAGSCSLNPPSTKAVTDNEVLNNLAIALQLLVLSNLLNNPPSDDELVNAKCPFAPVESLPPSSVPYTVSCASPSTSRSLPSMTPSSQPPYYHLPSQPSSQQPTYYPAPPSNAPTLVQNPTQYYPLYEANPTNACQPPPVMPNANFVGSASYSDGANVLTTFAGPFGSSSVPTKPPRASLALMSPYDAISPSSPYSDPILTSPYGSIMTSTKDFKSPYATFDSSSDFY